MHAVQFRGEKPNVRRKYLSPDEARRVIEASAKVGRHSERDKLLLKLIYRHGLRVSEAVDLRWTDFDLDAPKSRPFHVRRLKGSKDSVHTLEPDTARLLKRLQGDADGPYVFRSERGGPMSVDAVQVIVARAGREAGLGFKVHPHMLRHACGFFLAAHSGHRDRPIRPIVITRTGDRDHSARQDRGVPGGRHGRHLVVTTDGCPVSFFDGVRQAG